MNLRELFEPNLTELNMSPTNLRALASKTRATVGMEFEMILRDYQETDMDSDDAPALNFSDIENFFGTNNSSRTMDRVMNRLDQMYQEWSSDLAQIEFKSAAGTRWFTQWLRDNVKSTRAAEEMNVDPAEFSYQDFTEYCQNQNFENYWYEHAFTEYTEEQQIHNYKFSEGLFLQDQGLYTMSRVYDEFSGTLEMPSMSGEIYGAVARELELILGKEADWSDRYHGASRGDHYVVEPDASISPDSESYDLPVEIVSPPQSVTEALADYRKLRSWALKNKHYTNRSTGLHINVSLPNYKADLDWTKLVLLSGDEYVLAQFGRLNNHYTANALDLIQQQIKINRSDQSRRYQPVIKDALVNLVANKMDQLAQQIASQITHRRHLSVTVKHNRIEFRSPGGDWLQHKPEVIENTVYRYVVALDAAMDPQKYRQDYLKKMYQLVGDGKQSELVMGLFKYHRGWMSKAEFQQMLQSHYQTGLPKPTQSGTPEQ